MSYRTVATTPFLPFLVALAACQPLAPAGPASVSEWMRLTEDLNRVEGVAAPVGSRVTAYAAIALYESHVSDPRSGLRSLAGQVNGLWSLPLAPHGAALDGAIVAAETGRLLLDSLFSGGSARTRSAIDSLARTQIARRRSAGVSSRISERSAQHGQALGRALLAWAAKDGFVATRTRPWKAPRSATHWAVSFPAGPVRSGEPSIQLAGGDAKRAPLTLPRFDPFQATEPWWGTLRPFAIRNGDECAVPAVPAYSEQRGSDFWKLSRELGDSLAVLTADKRAMANLWSSDGTAATSPWRHWAHVIDQMIARRQLDADQAAEAYALAAVATADAFIDVWRQKYRAMGVRPSIYLRRVGHPLWQAAGTTPPSPEYPSDQSAIASAVAEVLSRTLGDTIPLTIGSDSGAVAPARAYRNFAHASEEAAVAGVYGGAQFVPSVVHGLTLGRCVGQRVRGRLKTRPESR